MTAAAIVAVPAGVDYIWHVAPPLKGRPTAHLLARSWTPGGGRPSLCGIRRRAWSDVRTRIDPDRYPKCQECARASAPPQTGNTAQARAARRANWLAGSLTNVAPQVGDYVPLDARNRAATSAAATSGRPET